jgi:choline dehydrogenase-like flavoprotein
VTYNATTFELASQAYIGPKLAAILKAAGAIVAGFIPRSPPAALPGLSNVPSGAHIFGTMRMGNDPKASVTDATGRMHDFDNILVTDGSVFPTSSGHNPTLTIMAVAWHSMEKFLGTTTPASAAATPTNVRGEQSQLPATGLTENLSVPALGAAAAGLFARSVAQGTADRANTEEAEG